ncbi:MAG: NADPH:quinone oxidoreductase family protein [Alphaproteobacteria bacterium]
MRAVVINKFGPIDSHEIEELPDPVPGPKEILIDTQVIGLNFPDTLMVQGLYQTKPDRPFTPGRDAAGVVSAVGAEVTRFKVGDRALAQVRWGAYSEKVVAPEDRSFVMPEEMDFVGAAAMGTVFPTAHVSLMMRCRYEDGESVLVNGAGGGIGLAGVQIAKAKGALVIAGDITEEKRQLALDNGADHAIDLSVDDLRENLRHQVFAVAGERGVDIVLDPVGGDVFDGSLRALAIFGRIATIGYASGRIPVAKANYFNIKSLTLAGIALDMHFRFKPETVHNAMADLFDLYLAGKVKPEVTGRYPFEEFKTAMNLFAARKTMGKTVLTVGDSA